MGGSVGGGGGRRGEYFGEEFLFLEVLELRDGLLEVEAGFVGHCWWGGSGGGFGGGFGGEALELFSLEGVPRR